MIPPTTPPTMAPIGVDRLAGELTGSVVEVAPIASNEAEVVAPPCGDGVTVRLCVTLTDSATSFLLDYVFSSTSKMDG